MTYVATDLGGSTPATLTRDNTRTIERTPTPSARDVQTSQLSFGASPTLARINARKTGVSRNAMVAGGVALVAVIAAGSAAFFLTPSKTSAPVTQTSAAAISPVAVPVADPGSAATVKRISTVTEAQTVRNATPATAPAATKTAATTPARTVQASAPAVRVARSAHVATPAAIPADEQVTPAPITPLAPLAVTPAAPQGATPAAAAAPSVAPSVAAPEALPSTPSAPATPDASAQSAPPAN